MSQNTVGELQFLWFIYGNFYSGYSGNGLWNCKQSHSVTCDSDEMGNRIQRH
jgi:hypothetical protein